MKNIAIILAGGSGNRFGSNIPKQFLNLAGKYIIEYTIEQFEINDKIDEICIVSHKDYIDKFQEITQKNNFKKVKKIITGGKERQDSSKNAIKAYDDKKEINLIFHDGVRPFITQKIINDTIKALKKYNAVDVAIPSADTIIKVDDNDIITDIPDRSNLRRGQTPQAFKLKTIKKAYELLQNDKTPPSFTDDCGLVKYYLNEDIYVVKGDEKNIKITYKEDLLFAEKILQLNAIEIKDEDLKLKGKTIVVFGGSSGIGKGICKIAKQNKAYVYSFSKSDNVDITNYKDITKALDKVDKKIDYIINCAGILEKKPLLNQDISMIDTIVDTNLKGSLYIAKASYEYLKQTKGMLLFFTSSSYTRGRGEYAAYSSTKAGVVNLTQALDEEFFKEGIRVNCINPSRTLTPMRVKNFGNEPKESLLDAKDVAKKALMILTKEISGQIIDIKKGF